MPRIDSAVAPCGEEAKSGRNTLDEWLSDLIADQELAVTKPGIFSGASYEGLNGMRTRMGPFEGDEVGRLACLLWRQLSCGVSWCIDYPLVHATLLGRGLCAWHRSSLTYHNLLWEDSASKKTKKRKIQKTQNDGYFLVQKSAFYMVAY